MNNRQAKKMVKKYATGWFYSRMHNLRANNKDHWINGKDFVVIPSKWWKYRRRLHYWIKKYYWFISGVENLRRGK